MSSCAASSCAASPSASPAARIQALYDAAAAVFGPNKAMGGRPRDADLAELCTAMDRVTPADLDLPPGPPKEGLLGALGIGPKADITYYEPSEPLETHHFTVGVFCLAPGASIPLHDHPGMVVASKLLTGKLRVRSFDWVDVDDEPATATRARRAKCVRSEGSEVSAGNAPVMVLHANDGGNIHEFTAVEYACILDVLAPPYDVNGSRPCTYYREAKPPQEDGAVWLNTFEPPSSFQVVRRRLLPHRMRAYAWLRRYRRRRR